MDRGAWQTTVYRVTKSWTQLKLRSMCARMRVEVVGIDRPLGAYRNVRVKGEISVNPNVLLVREMQKGQNSRSRWRSRRMQRPGHRGRNATAPSPQGNQAEGGMRLVSGKVMVDTEQESQWKLMCSRLSRKD